MNGAAFFGADVAAKNEVALKIFLLESAPALLLNCETTGR